MLAKSVVTYDGLPVGSGGAHHLRTRDPRVALAQIQSFLDRCTVDQSDLRFTVSVLSGEQEGISTVLKVGRLSELFPSPIGPWVIGCLSFSRCSRDSE
jgi:hypothetical protein